MNNARHLKKALLKSISILSEQKENFLFNPYLDFTRKRKLPFNELIKFIICMESGAIKDELYNKEKRLNMKLLNIFLKLFIKNY